MSWVNTNHLVTKEFDAAGRSESDILRSETAVHSAFTMDKVDSCKDTRTENRPHFLLGEGAVVLDSGAHFGFEGVVDVLENENNFMESGAE